MHTIQGLIDKRLAFIADANRSARPQKKKHPNVALNSGASLLCARERWMFFYRFTNFAKTVAPHILEWSETFMISKVRS